MKSITRLSIALVMMLASSAALAQTKLSPFAGEVRDIYPVNATTWLAATQGGAVYRTTNSGGAWAPAGSAAIRKAMRYVNKCAGVGTTVYCATGNGVFKSGDGGVNWSQLTYDAAATVAVDPANANNVLVGIKGVGVLKSSDGGATFAVRSSGISGGDIRVIHYHNSSTVYAGLVATRAYGVAGPTGETSGGGVYSSSNGGDSWADITSSPMTRDVSAITTDTGGNLYASYVATGQGAVYKYNGAGWIKTNTFVNGAIYAEWGATQLYRDPSNRIWMPTVYGTYYTADGGTTWQVGNTAQSFLNTTRTNAILVPSGNTVVRAVGGVGVWQTAGLNGITATELNTGLAAGRVRALELGSGTLFAGGIGAGVSISGNSGASWVRQTTGLDVGINATILPVELKDVVQLSGTAANNVYAAADLGGIYRFNGTAWAAVNEVGIDGNGVNNTGFAGGAYFVRPGGLLALPTGEVLYSILDTGGGSVAGSGLWYRSPAGQWTRPIALYGAQRVVQAGSRYFAMFFHDPMFIGTGANSYIQTSPVNYSTNPLPAPWFVSMAAKNANTIAASSNRGLFLSNNAGSTWAQLNAAGLPRATPAGLAFDASGRLYAGMHDGSVYCSTNDGNSWSAKATTLTSSSIIDVKVLGGTLYAITDGDGVYALSATCP